MRPANSIHNADAEPRIRKLTAVPAIDTIRIGRRPKRSDSLPRIGLPMICIAEYEAVSRPISSAEAPKRVA